MAFDLSELNELDFSDVGEWPIAIKVVVIAIVCIIILVAGFWFFNKPQLAQLDKARFKEKELKASFERKQVRASSLNAYKKQMLEIKQTFGTLLKRLPSKTEVPGLLEDISNAGVSSGLKVNLFKPLPEQNKGFYAELPIEISVIGNYHQFANFISKIAGLDRIVTVHDFAISKTLAQDNKKDKKSSSRNRGPLTMKLVAKTYRYLPGKGL